MWTAPKTDWQIRRDARGNYIGDYFSASDWNRIKNNMLHIYSMGSITAPDLGEDKVGNANRIDPIYASDFNKIENAIEYLKLNVADLDTGSPMEYFQNGRAITFEELNRLEDAEQKYYDYFSGQPEPEVYVDVTWNVRIQNINSNTITEGGFLTDIVSPLYIGNHGFDIYWDITPHGGYAEAVSRGNASNVLLGDRKVIYIEMFEYHTESGEVYEEPIGSIDIEGVLQNNTIVFQETIPQIYTRSHS